MENIQLNRSVDAHLNFSIAGEITHKHIKGLDFYLNNNSKKKFLYLSCRDYGIFITNIISCLINDKNRQLKANDRLKLIYFSFSIIINFLNYYGFTCFKNRIDECRGKITDETFGTTGRLKPPTRRQFFIR